MSCGCGCGSCGLGRNLDLSILGRNRRGLRGLRGLLKTGTPIQQGFQIGLFNSQIDDAVKDGTFEGCLYKTGAFSSVKVSLSGYLNVYLLVEGVTSIDFGAPEDLTSIIVSTIQGCIGRYDLIKEVKQIATGEPPEEFKNDPNVQQSTYKQYYGIPTEAPPPPGTPPKADECAYDKSGKKREGFDYLSCKLGLGGTSGTSAGLIVAIIAAVVIAKAFK